MFISPANAQSRGICAAFASALLIIAGAGLPLTASAHPELEAQIETVTAQLSSEPTNATLWLRRAELRRRHAEFAAAHADVTAAERVETNLPAAKILRAQIFLDDGKVREALAQVENALREAPQRPEALVLRGRCHVALGQPKEAAADFSAALAQVPKPSPDLLLERAQAQAASGDLAGAVRGLDEGLEKLGNIPSLELPAIEYECARKNFPGALARVERIIARQSVKESWLVLRGEILEQAGSAAEARASFRQAIEGIAAYPATRRGLELTQQLEARARAGLARLDAKFSQSVSGSNRSGKNPDKTQL